MKICDDKKCYGCGVCAESCPFHAISMQRDEDGFLRPSVSEKDCRTCGLCRKICPANQNTDDALRLSRQIYCFKHSSDEVRKASSSGGAFTAFAEYVLSKHGKVYGSALKEDLTATEHISACDMVQLSPMHGSKYVQSDMTMCYGGIEEDLQQGRYVLFTGTACQVFALKRELRQKNIPTDNLITCDIICHGVASPRIFEEFIGYLQKKTGGKLRAYHFRDKAISWRGGSSAAYLENGKCLANTPLVASYMNVYYSGCITRECCYSCPFASERRVSDATIGDFWGIEKALPAAEDSLGVSVVLANSQKALDILSEIPAALALELPLSVLKQPNLHHPTARPANREEFWRSYRKKGISYVLHHYGSFGLQYKINSYWNVLKRYVKK